MRLTDRTQLGFSEHPTLRATPHMGERVLECSRKRLCTLTITFEEMQRHALCALRSDAGQAPQCIQQAAQAGTEYHPADLKTGA